MAPRRNPGRNDGRAILGQDQTERVGIGGRINATEQKYEALGRNCHWYTRNVINSSGARVPTEAAMSKGRAAPRLCVSGRSCTPPAGREGNSHIPGGWRN